MYYQNGNYMQDLNYYNQNPNANMNYNPYMNNNYSAQNMGMNAQVPMQNQQQNLSAMYPAIYRIISPVVSQVLMNNNYGYITEENLNIMVDTVYNIVEGDINLTNNSATTPNTESSNQNNSSCERNSSTSRQNNASNSNSRTNSQNTLLRDLIKIMILNEISERNRNSNANNPYMMSNNFQNPNMNTSMYMR